MQTQRNGESRRGQPLAAFAFTLGHGPARQNPLPRNARVRREGHVVYCADYKCSHSHALSAEQWADDVRLSDTSWTVALA